MVVNVKIGLLEYESEIINDSFSIRPLDDYLNVIKYLKDISNVDGFIYPPSEHGVELDITTMKQKRVIPNTERPSLLHKLPPSHAIELSNPVYENDTRKWDLSFIVHLLAFIMGVRLQFHDWWFDGRVPIKNTNNIYASPPVINEFLKHCYDVWLSWEEQHRQWIINLLVMHSRVPSYEWDWEKFTLNYMVFDGAYRLANEIYNCKAKNHKDRFNVLIERFGLAHNDQYIDQIYNLRNDLFHQSIWDGGLPCSSEGKYRGWAHETTLRKLNIRIITALFKYDTKFIQMPWWSISSHAFDPKFYD